MNPIEYACDELGRLLHQINNVYDLEQTLVAQWNPLPQDFFQRLCDSMRRRCQACIDAREGTRVIEKRIILKSRRVTFSLNPHLGLMCFSYSPYV